MFRNLLAKNLYRIYIWFINLYRHNVQKIEHEIFQLSFSTWTINILHTKHLWGTYKFCKSHSKWKWQFLFILWNGLWNGRFLLPISTWPLADSSDLWPIPLLVIFNVYIMYSEMADSSKNGQFSKKQKESATSKLPLLAV